MRLRNTCSVIELKQAYADIHRKAQQLHALASALSEAGGALLEVAEQVESTLAAQPGSLAAAEDVSAQTQRIREALSRFATE